MVDGWYVDAAVNIQDKDGSIPLHIAALIGGYKIAKLLVDNDTDINIQDIILIVQNILDN